MTSMLYLVYFQSKWPDLYVSCVCDYNAVSGVLSGEVDMCACVCQLIAVSG